MTVATSMLRALPASTSAASSRTLNARYSMATLMLADTCRLSSEARRTAVNDVTPLSKILAVGEMLSDANS